MSKDDPLDLTKEGLNFAFAISPKDRSKYLHAKNKVRLFAEIKE
jgi:hypothetical protein